MSHARYDELLAAYRDLDDAERAEIGEHLQSCPECATRLAAYQVMDQELAALPEATPRADFGERFARALARRQRQSWYSARAERLAEAAIAVALVIGAWFVVHNAFRAGLFSQPGVRPTPAPTLAATPSATPTRLPDGAAIADLWQIHMVDAAAGWAQTTEGAILRTTDGGRGWVEVTPPGVGAGSYLAPLFQDATVAWVAAAPTLSSAVTVYRTGDGGRTWESSQLPEASTAPVMGLYLSACDANSAWVLVQPQHGMSSSPGSLFATADGGARWTLVASTATPFGGEGTLPYGGEISFTSASDGWLSGVRANTMPAELSVTRDGGHTWQPVILPSPAGHEGWHLSPGLPRLIAPDYHQGVVPVTLWPPTDRPGRSALVLYLTLDGGQTWEPTTPLPDGALGYFAGPEFGWAWASDPSTPARGTLHLTRDGGRSWEPVPGKPGLESLLEPGGRVVALQFPDEATGWALLQPPDGASRRLAKTEDGGESWAAVDAWVTASAPPAPPVDGWTGTIALFAKGNGTWSLPYALAADGSSVRVSATAGQWLAASPSGRWLAYADGQGNAVALSLEARRAITVSAGGPGSFFLGAAFDREERRVAWVLRPLVTADRERMDIVVVDLADGRTSRFGLRLDRDFAVQPRQVVGWMASSDELLLAIPARVAGGGSRWGVWALDLPHDAASPSQDSLYASVRWAVPAGACAAIPHLSPDGTRLLYLRRDESYTPANYKPAGLDVAVNQLWELDLASGRPALLLEVTDGGALANGAAWSPDGSEVLFAEGRYDGERSASLLLKARSASGAVRQIGPLPVWGHVASLHWSSGGRALVAVSAGQHTQELYVADLASGDVRRAASGAELAVLGCPSVPVPPAALREPDLRPLSQVWGEYEIILSAGPDDHRKTEVSVRQRETGAEVYRAIVPDAYLEHYHNVEFHSGNLYVIRRLGYDGYPDEDWADELWRCDAQGQSVRIYSAQGLDFRVAPGEADVAVLTAGTLYFVDPAGSSRRGYTLAQLSGRDWQGKPAVPAVFLLQWSRDGRALWGSIQLGPQALGLYRVEPGSWRVTSYDVSELPMAWEYDLDPNTGLAAYSDHPAVLDAEGAERFQESGQTVTLYVHDLETGSTQSIARSAARPFRPRWLDDATLEFDDPAGDGRLRWEPGE